MMDRGIIKWQPFDSCFSSKKMVNDLSFEKAKVSMPILSEDQIKVLQEKIIDAYNLKIPIYLEYYYDGLIKNAFGKIDNINYQEKKIYLNHKFIYFKQILKINY